MQGIGKRFDELYQQTIGDLEGGGIASQAAARTLDGGAGAWGRWGNDNESRVRECPIRERCAIME